jgi:hypothetical protein
MALNGIWEQRPEALQLPLQFSLLSTGPGLEPSGYWSASLISMSVILNRRTIDRLWTPNREPRKKPREEPGSEGSPVLFWLCQVEIIWVHGCWGQIVLLRCSKIHRWPAGSNNNHSGATGLHLRSKCHLTFHNWAFGGEDSRCGRERDGREGERGSNSRSWTR